MSGLISRQAALDIIDAELSGWLTDDERLHLEGVRTGIECLPNINPFKNGMWALCKEELPKANGRYLVTRGLNACGSLWNRVYILNYSDLMGTKSEKIWWQGNVGKSDFERIDDVIAWMPLPEPYKGGRR